MSVGIRSSRRQAAGPTTRRTGRESHCEEPNLGALQTLNLVIGALQLVLGLLVLRYLGRFGRSFPWLVALMLFALARGGDRFYVGLSGNRAPRTADLVTDALAAATLLLLMAGLRATIRGLRIAEREAATRTADYERALGDYRRVLRHRIGNRIASIRGSAQTLRARPDLPGDLRDALLQTLDEETAKLEAEALDERLYSSEPRGIEERELQPRPEVTTRPGRSLSP